jgi:hypothetical protein
VDCFAPLIADKVAPDFVLTELGLGFFTALLELDFEADFDGFVFEVFKPVVFVFKAVPLPWDGWLAKHTLKSGCKVRNPTPPCELCRYGRRSDTAR